MATPRTTQGVTTVNNDQDQKLPGQGVPVEVEDEEFALPSDEFIQPTPSTTSATMPSSNSGSSNNANSTLDLDSASFNNVRDETERAKLDPPTGDWDKTDSWKSEVRCQQGNCQPGDLDPHGRTTIGVMGKPKPRVVGSLEYEPTLFVRISPDLRYKEDKPTEVDNAYKLFLKAKDLYIALNSEKPSTLKQLKVMLEEDSFVVRTMKGDNGPIVVDIKAKRVQR